MREAPYADRTDAGRVLGKLLAEKRISDPVVVAIPRGGVPVGVEIARVLHAPLHLILLRKLFIPSNSEAGLGAMAPDGSVFVDESWVRVLGMSQAQVERVVEQVRDELERRKKVYTGVTCSDVEGRDVILTDDGIAAGYSMSAAAQFVRNCGPRSLRVAVPCAPKNSLSRVRPHVDEIVCPHAAGEGSFAVASYYREWHDLTDEEAGEFLDEFEDNRTT